MIGASKPTKSASTYLIIVWMVINAVFMVLGLTIFGDAADLNNSIELVLWVASIVGLVSMRKLGVALSIFTFCYTLSTSMSNIIYYSIWLVNAPRVIINAVIIVYLFKSLFADKFK